MNAVSVLSTKRPFQDLQTQRSFSIALGAKRDQRDTLLTVFRVERINVVRRNREPSWSRMTADTWSDNRQTSQASYPLESYDFTSLKACTDVLYERNQWMWHSYCQPNTSRYQIASVMQLLAVIDDHKEDTECRHDSPLFKLIKPSTAY